MLDRVMLVRVYPGAGVAVGEGTSVTGAGNVLLMRFDQKMLKYASLRERSYWLESKYIGQP